MSNQPVNCLSCKKQIYLRKNDAMGKWDKFDDPDFKTPHKEPFTARKPQYKLTAGYTRVKNLGNYESERYELDMEFPADTKPEEALKKVKEIVLNFAGIADRPSVSK